MKKIITILMFTVLMVTLVKLQTGLSSVSAETPVVLRTHQFHFLEGWNLFAFPFTPKSDKKLTTDLFIKSLNLQGGLVTTIARWENGGWQEYVKRQNGEVYGTDFPLEIGRSYFVKNYKEFDYQLTGTEVTDNRLSLKTGYNFIGLPTLEVNGKYSSALVENLLKSKPDLAPQMSQYFSGLFTSYTVNKNTKYGVDFPLDRFHGYVIKVDQPVEIEIK